MPAAGGVGGRGCHFFFFFSFRARLCPPALSKPRAAAAGGGLARAGFSRQIFKSEAEDPGRPAPRRTDQSQARAQLSDWLEELVAVTTQGLLGCCPGTAEAVGQRSAARGLGSGGGGAFGGAEREVKCAKRREKRAGPAGGGSSGDDWI